MRLHLLLPPHLPLRLRRPWLHGYSSRTYISRATSQRAPAPPGARICARRLPTHSYAATRAAIPPPCAYSHRGYTSRSCTHACTSRHTLQFSTARLPARRTPLYGGALYFVHGPSPPAFLCAPPSRGGTAARDFTRGGTRSLLGVCVDSDTRRFSGGESWSAVSSIPGLERRRRRENPWRVTASERLLDLPYSDPRPTMPELKFIFMQDPRSFWERRLSNLRWLKLEALQSSLFFSATCTLLIDGFGSLDRLGTITCAQEEAAYLVGYCLHLNHNFRRTTLTC
ncbi:hypothetical protein FB451DRAFT_1188492 [Mycena latifolia]|nr:hypothetical protein FB451DRAFT_1188492 [Mycena latifolia]